MTLRGRLTGLAACALLALAGGNLAACGDNGSTSGDSGGGSTSGGSGTGGTLVYAEISDPLSIDPAIANGNADFAIVRNVYDHLTTYDESDPGRILSALATSWREDGKRWTFTLRDGVTFQDGTTFDADDAAASINRLIRIGQGQAYLIDSVASAKAVDPQTLELTLKEPDAYLAANLAHIEIASKDDIDKQARGGDLAQGWFKTHANGTGPYSLVSMEKGAQIVLARNEKWWGEWPASPADRVIVKVVPDGTTRAQGLEGGEFDLANLVPADQARRIGRSPGFSLVSGDNLFAYPAIYLNTASGPTEDPQFREALVKAFDYQAMVDYNDGNGTIPRGPIPDWFPGSPESQLPEIGQNLAGARAALEAAGTSSRDILCSVPNIAPEFKFAATVLQASAKQIGVNVRIEEVPLAEALDKAKKKQTNCFVLGNAIISPADPTKFFDAHYVSTGFFNAANLHDASLDALVNRISTTLDDASRDALVLEAARKVVDSHAIIWAARPLAEVPVPDRVKGYKVDPTEYVNARFYELSLDG